MSDMLEAIAVDFAYRRGQPVLHGLSFRWSSGIVGLLGPNGAGKSTLMRLLATLAKPSAGRILWNDVDIVAKPQALRAVLGYLPQEFGLYPALSAREFLRYLAAVKNLGAKIADERVEQCLAWVGLSDAGDRRLGDFSSGMRQRVGIAQALLADPKLLIVDEPTAGLDPEERLRFRHLLTDLAGDRLVILSTHIVSDVEASAGRIAVLERGRLLFDGDPEAMLAHVQGKVWDWWLPESRVADARQGLVISGSLRRGDQVGLRVVGVSPSADATPATPTLEDAYLYLRRRAPEAT
jgi:ABC-2 type transport system ATP-binding protein